MKLCFIAAASAVHTQRWVHYFINQGDEVHLISPVPLRNTVSDGIELYVLKTFPLRIGIIHYVINLLLGIIEVRILLKKIHPDIVHARYVTDCGLLAAFSGFHPCILRPMGSDIFIDAKRNPILKAFIRRALKKADWVICNSQGLKKGVMELGVEESKISIIYDGVDTRQFSPQKRDEGLKNNLGISGAPTVISVRNLRPIYNVETLIKAIPLVVKEMPDARFIIGGDGDQTKYLQGLVSSLGISSAVRFTGWIQHDELPRYLASSDVYVTTSLSDSNSISLQEAMASGLAPVVTDIPANHEFLTHGENAFLIPVGDFEGLAERIIYLLKNKAARDLFGKACRQLIMERSEHKKEMGKITEIYQELTGK